MTPTQTTQVKQSKARERLAAILKIETRSDDEQAEMVELTDNTLPGLEIELRAAIASEADGSSPKTADPADGIAGAPGEDPKRVELRSAANVAGYLRSAGRSLSGAEAELNEELGLPDNAIPLEMWKSVETRAEVEERAATDAPGTVGINLRLIPQVFAPSAAAMLRVDMPLVESGSYATARIVAGAGAADAVAKDGAVPEIANTWAVEQTTPHRVGGSVQTTLEAIASVGVSNFEALLRSQISLILSSELDRLLINGDEAGGSNEPDGFIAQITAAAAAAATVATFDEFLGEMVAGIDGLWASRMTEVAALTNPQAYRLAASTFRDASGANGDRGETSFADYAAAKTAGFMTNKRMPDTVAHEALAILVRHGQSMSPDPMQTAVCPSWGYVSIDDIYSGALKGQRRYVLNTLVGDLVITQPDAYAVRTITVSV